MTTARLYSSSSSFKMALLFTVLCGLAVLILGYFTYYFNHGSFIRTVETSIDTEVKYVSLVKKTLPDKTSFEAYLDTLPNTPDRIYIFSAKDQNDFGILTKSLPKHIEHLSEGLLVFTSKEKQYAAKIHTFNDGSRLLIGIDITTMSNDHKRMLYLSIISIALMLMVIGISYAISHFVVTRTNRIVLRAREIMETGDLSRRLDIDSDWDDLSYMSNVLNIFLDRIEQLMQGVRQVSDNIAHDLRTPLTRMRHKIERLKDPRIYNDQQLLQEIGNTLSEEADHLLNTFSALLRISRIESGHQHSPFQIISMDKLVIDVLEFYEPLAEDKSLRIIPELDTINYFGDRDLLFQAVANVIDNAIKFTPENGGDITIRLYKDDNALQLVIHDQGPGIAEPHKNRVFDRYYRADSSRHLPGNGLGLSLVMAIIRLHNGQITLPTPASGLKVMITLPYIIT